MTVSFLKAIVWGALIGSLAYFAPFIIISFLIIGLIIKLSFRNRFMHGHYGSHHLAYADKIRTMSEDDYAGYKARFSSGHFGPCGHRKANTTQSSS